MKKKTLAIDKKISLLNKKINLYREVKKSLIDETICRGLDENIKLKPSGIDRLGNIPEHWAISRLKDLGAIETSSVNKKIEEDEAMVKLVNYTDVYGNYSREIWNSESYMLVSAKNEQIKAKNLKKGDVLFTPSSETIEEIGISAVVMEDLENTLYSYHLIRLRFSTKINHTLKKYVFNNDKVQCYFSKTTKGTTRKILGLNDFNNLKIIFPPMLKEQTVIANYLEEKTDKIDSIVNNIKEQIATLKELRKTLINDVVTGKLKVCG